MGEIHRFPHLFDNLGLQLIESRGWNPLFLQVAAEKNEGIPLHPSLQLTRLPVEPRIADEMAVVAISLALKEGRTFAPPRPVAGGQSCLPHRQDIVAVDDGARDLVSGGPVRDVFHLLMAALTGAHAIHIVLRDENHGQIPNGGQVQCLMESALVARTIPKEAGYHLTVLPLFRGQSHAVGDGDAAANDTIGANDAPVEIRDMHRTALALAAAGDLAVDFRHHGLKVSSLGQNVPVAPVGADHIVILPQGRAHPNGNCFLADGGMEESWDSPGQEGLGHLVFKMTDLQHRLMQ